ncbi:MAG: PEP/pyruvate-binding domain-containing protein [Myxococcales bacterium]
MATTDARSPRGQEPWYVTFHDLMPFRVREILLVSSPYDAFTLEEDGRLTERIFTENAEISLSTAPRITHCSTGARAFELMAERRFDLVMTMVRIADTDVSSFGRKVKELYPSMPVVLLVLTEADLNAFPGGVDAKSIDHTFWWTGDARIILAIVKLVEDSLNAPHDTATAGVRCIIVVEDSVRRYSSFLSLLYAELMAQSNSLSAEGVNDLTRILRMRARPKLLLARTFEEAMGLYRRYKDHVVAAISDVRYPRGGEEDPQAGFALVKAIRAEDPELPILVQSAEPENAALAAEAGVHYADKNSNELLKKIQSFVTESLGFGDFIFRLPDRTEVGRARTMWDLEQLLRTAPGGSLEYHANRNHFSLWMMARCMFDLARRVRPTKPSDFGGAEGLRKYLVGVVEEARLKHQEGVITDFSSKQATPQTPFLRVGSGSIGGKARGLAFVSSVLARNALKDRFGELQVRIPRSIVVPTDEFDKFIESNRILDGGLKNLDEKAILQRCLVGQLSQTLMGDLRRAVAHFKGPLAVRSSSLLEDSQLQPFAGIYNTYMLPNNHPDPEVRFQELCQAIKAVYASTYSADARAYIDGTPYSLEEEKMAVLIQEIVGNAYGTRFYPNASGVAVSYNYYPIGHQKADDGLAMVALGLGQTIVQGGQTLQFSPSTPNILPQFGSPQDYLRYSQRQFWALDLSRQRVDFTAGAEASLVQLDVTEAEQDETLKLVGSVYSPDDDVIRDDLGQRGPRVVSFHNILKWGAIPMPEALAEVLRLFRDGMGCPVEVEFALDAGDWGRSVERGVEPRPPSLFVLQVRPQGTQLMETDVDTEAVDEDQVLCRTDRSLGHGCIETIKDIVFVKRQELEANETPAIADEVGAFNTKLTAEKKPYLLVGPGRWGSSDARLGIPVKWAQIAGAKVIVETPFGEREVEPSQGAHFFHNVTSFRIGYLTLSNLEHQHTAHRRQCDLAWLEGQKDFVETKEVRHIKLERPIRVLLDGKKSRATILKPG